jgi:hypothetical protein
VGALAGITRLARLIECIQRGFVYEAHVLTCGSTHCRVRVVNAGGA